MAKARACAAFPAPPGPTPRPHFHRDPAPFAASYLGVVPTGATDAQQWKVSQREHLPTMLVRQPRPLQVLLSCGASLAPRRHLQLFISHAWADKVRPQF